MFIIMPIEITESDIFNVEADALVNPANRQPSLFWDSHINERMRE